MNEVYKQGVDMIARTKLRHMLCFALLQIPAVSIGFLAASCFTQCEVIDCFARRCQFEGVALIVCFAVANYFASVLMFRLFMRLFPLRPGEVESGSSLEFIYNIYLQFMLVFYHPISKSNILPIFLLRTYFIMWGAKIGKGSFPACYLADPILTVIGENTIIGSGCVVTPHILTAKSLSHLPVKIGRDVTIGPNSVICGGAKIGDGPTVLPLSVIFSDTMIPENEMWIGNLAKFLKKLKDKSEEAKLGKYIFSRQASASVLIRNQVKQKS